MATCRPLRKSTQATRDAIGLHELWRGITEEEKEEAKKLLHAALQHDQVATYLLVKEIAFTLADRGEHERLPEILTGYGY